jgi:hypothetical protein
MCVREGGGSVGEREEKIKVEKKEREKGEEGVRE